MDSIFWNINNSVSYNALFNFIIGNRGGGKTYGMKNYVINKFIKKGEQFIYLRRYKTEVKRINTFFTIYTSLNNMFLNKKNVNSS